MMISVGRTVGQRKTDPWICKSVSVTNTRLSVGHLKGRQYTAQDETSAFSKVDDFTGWVKTFFFFFPWMNHNGSFNDDQSHVILCSNWPSWNVNHNSAIRHLYSETLLSFVPLCQSPPPPPSPSLSLSLSLLLSTTGNLFFHIFLSHLPTH